MKRLMLVVMVLFVGVVPALGNGTGEKVEFRATIGDDGVQRVRITGVSTTTNPTISSSG